DNQEAQRDWRYYHEAVEPHLKGPGVDYLGELGTADKHAFLAGAMGLLFPVRWPEPFGLAMVEALACGTPVIALRRGSVPEVIEHGITGFVADDEDGLVRAVSRLGEIDPARCRAVVERRFSPSAMAEGYEQAYYRLLGMVPPDGLTVAWPSNDGAQTRVPILTAAALRTSVSPH
ncbi:MAG TPA: glycosyltransferase, partial [Chloroflexota bacterium]|nr:glycosyltransferase [Chloroflexota bacterium]